MNSEDANSTLDWRWVRSFLAVLESGSLSTAAARLDLSQPTLGRHIQLLEQHCGQQLFQRTNQGLSPTDEALALRPAAEQMQRGAHSLLRRSAGREEALSGTIRLSVNEIMAVYLLPAALVAFRQLHPQIQIEIVVTNATSSLSKREADMALRMYRPTDHTLVAVKLAEIELGFYASDAYLQGHPIPQSPTDLEKHTLIGFDQDDTFIEGARAQGWQLTAKDFDYRCDNLLMGIALMQAAAGVLVTHCGLADHMPNIHRVCPQISLPKLSLWIASHHDLRGSARMRVFSQFLQTWYKNDPYDGI